MKHFKQYALTAILIFTCCFSWAQTKANDKMNFEKIVFHSSRCNGTCPQIDFQIDSKKNIVIDRVFYKTKSTIDNSKTGKFKGSLDNKTYNKLLQMLKKSDFENLKFPDVDCCDGVVTTIIIYSNNKRTYLKSMTPPDEAKELISFLHQLGANYKLKKTKGKIALEE